MKMYEVWEIFRENPKLAILGIIISLLTVYRMNINSQLSNLQRKERKAIPKLKVGSAKKIKGIIFGRKGRKVFGSPIEDEGHVFCCASSGAGKTTSIVIPSIRSACSSGQKGTCMCVDISGDIASACEIPNKIVFNIEDPQTVPYNIFAQIDQEERYEMKNEMLTKLAFLIMPDSKIDDSAGQFFKQNGRNMLIGALITYYYQGLDFVEICKKILDMDYSALLYDIVSIGNEDAIRYIASFSGANEKNSAGCKQCLDSQISLFGTNFRMKYAVRRPNKGEECVTPQLLEQNNIFLQIPDSKTDLYGPFLGICFAQAFDYCASRKNGARPTVLFVLDEFASLKISETEILNAVRKYRKKNVRIMLLTQALVDLDILYNEKTREAILNNVRYKVILGITDPKSQKYFADIIGKRQVQRTTTTVGQKSSISYSTQEEYRVKPETFGQLKDDLYLICDDATYIKLSKNYYFKYGRR